MKLSKFRNNSKSSASIDKYLCRASSTNSIKNHSDITKIYNINNKDKKNKKVKKLNDSIYNNVLYKDHNMDLY